MFLWNMSKSQRLTSTFFPNESKIVEEEEGEEEEKEEEEDEEEEEEEEEEEGEEEEEEEEEEKEEEKTSFSFNSFVNLDEINRSKSSEPS